MVTTLGGSPAPGSTVWYPDPRYQCNDAAYRAQVAADQRAQFKHDMWQNEVNAVNRATQQRVDPVQVARMNFNDDLTYLVAAAEAVGEARVKLREAKYTKTEIANRTLPWPCSLANAKIAVMEAEAALKEEEAKLEKRRDAFKQRWGKLSEAGYTAKETKGELEARIDKLQQQVSDLKFANKECAAKITAQEETIAYYREQLASHAPDAEPMQETTPDAWPKVREGYRDGYGTQRKVDLSTAIPVEKVWDMDKGEWVDKDNG